MSGSNEENTSKKEEGSVPLLTEESVGAYVSNHAAEIGVFDASDNDKLVGKAIMGGNVNFAFCVSSADSKKSVFVKQAPEYVAIFGPDGFPLTSMRMDKEYNVYKVWEQVLGDKLSLKFLPKIYHFDRENRVFVMEFLDGFTLLDHDLVGKGIVPTSIAAGLAEFMGKTHAATHCSIVSKEKAAEMDTEYENRAMRDIQLEFVFSKCYKEASEEQRAGLVVDDAFMKEIDLLKKQYNGEMKDNLALCHGDLHPGSVMVKCETGDVKVIDPEFTVYGPPGLDVGSLLSGYVLAAIHQAYSDNGEAVETIYQASMEFWKAYQKSMLEGGISEELLKQTEIDTVGFTVAEVCRTALGFAGGRLWLQFEDPQVKAGAIKAAMQIVAKCMIGRHEGGIQLLLNEIKNLTAK